MVRVQTWAATRAARQADPGMGQFERAIRSSKSSRLVVLMAGGAGAGGAKGGLGQETVELASQRSVITVVK